MHKHMIQNGIELNLTISSIKIDSQIVSTIAPKKEMKTKSCSSMSVVHWCFLPPRHSLLILSSLLLVVFRSMSLFIYSILSFMTFKLSRSHYLYGIMVQMHITILHAHTFSFFFPLISFYLFLIMLLLVFLFVSASLWSHTFIHTHNVNVSRFSLAVYTFSKTSPLSFNQLNFNEIFIRDICTTMRNKHTDYECEIEIH